MFEYFTEKAIAVIMSAQQEARQMGHSFVGTEQILLGLLHEKTTPAARVLLDAGLTLDSARSEVEQIIGRGSGGISTEVPLTPKTKRVLEKAYQTARHHRSPAVTPEHLLLAMTETEDSVAIKVLRNLGVDIDSVRSQLQGQQDQPQAAFAGTSPQAPRPFGGSRTAQTLEAFGTDLTRKAANGELDPVVGRDREIERVVQILGRRSKNNPVLIGEPGVGKTAIAEGLAQRIVNQDVPESLYDKRVISLDMGLLISGTRFRGDFEERLKQVVEEVTQDGNIILLIDELHTLVGGGSMEGGIDAANMLKPALARGSFQCIGATTLDEYRKHIERDAALERRFQPVMVAPPSVEETIAILQGLRRMYEEHHALTISDEALKAAAILSDRYIMDRYLPDKAIDLMDEAGSRVRLRYSQNSPARDLKRQLRQVQQEKKQAVAVQDFDQASDIRDRELELEAQIQTLKSVPSEDGPETAGPSVVPLVTEEDIAQVVAAWTGVPVNRLTESESALLMHLEDTLHERVIGQHEAVTAVARAIRRSRVGLKNPSRPMASLLFAGPTGVGKTELAKALAITVFGAESAMIRLDMSEFMERHTVSKLIGSPPGYVGFDEGGQLTEAVRRNPYTVVLMDEIEKAHPDVFNLLLQVLEDGHLTDSKGRKVSFKNTLLIMTSNIGSKVIEKGGRAFGFDASTDAPEAQQYNRMRSLVQEEMKQYFRPEFLNRLDEIIVFSPLARQDIMEIADVQLAQINGRLTEQAIALEMTDAFRTRLVDEGYNPSYGARPLRRAISRLIEDELAEALLEGRIQSGDRVILDVSPEGHICVRRAEAPALAEVC